MLSPYTRATYRYTPLLALLLAPNEWLHPAFGKVLFAACDILAGVLMYELLVSDILPLSRPRSRSAPTTKPRESKQTPEDEGDGERRRQATALVALHLLSPLVFTISTRGSSESVLVLFVLGTLHCALRARWDAAAVLLGLSTHWKIYPVVYAAACLGVIGRERGTGRGQGWKVWVREVVNWRTLRFAAVSGTTFVLLGAGMYAMYVPSSSSLFVFVFVFMATDGRTDGARRSWRSRTSTTCTGGTTDTTSPHTFTSSTSPTHPRARRRVL